MNLNIIESSANRRMCELVIEKTVSLMNKLKRRKEKWTPWWETLEVTDIGDDKKFLNSTNWVRCDKKDSNHDKRGYFKANFSILMN